jgi:hypothetical protein
MYLRNLLNITGRLPGKMIKRSTRNATQSIGEKLATKGSRFTIAAFLLLGVFFAAGCESSGTVGDGLRPDDNEVTKSVVNLDAGNMQAIDANTFSGRLQRSAAGYLEDPAYGTLRAVTLLKPSISRATVDTIRDADSITLKLSISSVSYGNELDISDFTVYEAGELWRGNELRYNQEISVDNSTPVATFQLTDEDSIEVELSSEWTDKFRSYFNSTASNRDSTYINEFPGLAIVPAETNNRIHFIRHLQEAEDDPIETEFIVYTEDTSDEEEEEEQDPVAQRLSLRDWGSSVIRSNEPDYDSGIVLYNSERILRIDPQIDAAAFQNRNIVNATLILTKDTSEEDLAPTISRPELFSVRAHEFDPVPADIISEMFITTAPYNGIADEGEETYRINITQYVMNEIFGDTGEGPLFISLQAVDGFLYSALFFDETAPDHLRPRIVITSVE